MWGFWEGLFKRVYNSLVALAGKIECMGLSVSSCGLLKKGFGVTSAPCFIPYFLNPSDFSRTKSTTAQLPSKNMESEQTYLIWQICL